MLAADPVPKRNRLGRHKVALGALVFFFALVLAGYLAWTRVSAIMVLRWAVDELGAPIEVVDARWDLSLRALLTGSVNELHGSIGNLHLWARYKPLNADVVLRTPVTYHRSGMHWTFELEPVLKFGDLIPSAQGKMRFELDVARIRNRAKALGSLVSFELRETQPYQHRQGELTLSAASWKLDGKLRWDPHESEPGRQWQSETTLVLNDVRARKDDTHLVQAKSLRLESTVRWPKAPPLPLEASTKLTLTDANALVGSLFIEEPELALRAAFGFDGHDLDAVELFMDKPFRLTAQGGLAGGKGRATFKLTGSLEDLFTQRAAKWLEPVAPLLRRAKAKGELTLNGRLSTGPAGLHANGNLKLQAKTVEFPSRDLFVDDVELRLPLEYPGLPDWGEARVGNVEFHSVKLKRLLLFARVSREGVDASTEDEDGVDHPIRQSVWGGAFDIAHLFAHLGGKTGDELAASVTGGPFALSAVQSDLCVLPKNPLAGSVSFTYPKIVRDRDSIRLIGDTNLELFGGQVHVGDLNLVTEGSTPRLAFEAEWSDLDLHEIGKWTKIGDMKGSLEGSLKGANFWVTRYGLVPRSYHFTIRGRERGGTRIRFYGRSGPNLVKVLTGGKDDLPGVLTTVLDVTALWRNLMPLTAEYMGFEASANEDWTELRTFDDEEITKDKKHYLLFGSQFKIPLEAHDVYPVLMKTDAFQGWLSGLVQYAKKNFLKDKKNAESEEDCKPLW